MRPKSPMDLAPLDFGRAQRAAFPFREGTTAATGAAVEPRSGVGFHDAQAQKFKKMSSDAKPAPDVYKAAQRAEFSSGQVTNLTLSS